MAKIHDSIRVLMLLSFQIVERNEIVLEERLHIKAEKDKPSDRELFHFMTFFHMNIINAAAFLDEYYDYFGIHTEKKYKERAITVKRFLKPVTTEINKWSDLKRLRNEFSAHNMRADKREKAFIFSEILLSYKAPSNFKDLIYLSDLLQIILRVIQAEFDVEAKEMQSIKSLTKSERGIPVTTPEYASSNLSRIAFEVNLLLKQEGREYGLHGQSSVDWSKIKA